MVYWGHSSIRAKMRFSMNCCETLKAKKTHGFNPCIMIRVYPLDISSIKKYTEYRSNC